MSDEKKEGKDLGTLASVECARIQAQKPEWISRTHINICIISSLISIWEIACFENDVKNISPKSLGSFVMIQGH